MTSGESTQGVTTIVLVGMPAALSAWSVSTACESGRGHAEKEQVGGELAVRLRLSSVARLRHDLERRIGLEQPSEAFSEDRMSVGDDNSYAFHETAKASFKKYTL